MSNARQMAILACLCGL